MIRSSHLAVPASLGAALLFGASALAQVTTPFWSTMFGGSGRDEIVAICRGPGPMITVVGWTQSPNLPVTPGCVQPVLAGTSDAFVARIDPSNQQVVWCTYLGGSGLELVFDAEVDASGTTALCGLTTSPNFPGFSSLNGTSDGFVAQFDASGTLLPTWQIGGSGDDRVCDVDTSGPLTIAGVTESPNLPAASSFFHGGFTEAFVARLAQGSPPVIQSIEYLGGSGREGIRYVDWAGFGASWPGNLDRMALTVDASGAAVIATVTGSFNAATTVPLGPNGLEDVYLAVVSPTGVLQYGRYLGGTNNDRPNGIAIHPAGGYVIVGTTFSADFPCTVGCFQSTFRGGPFGLPSDAFVTHVDPALPGNGLRYSTFLGGDAGEDHALDVAVESSGVVVAAGFSSGGNFPTTPRCLQSAHGTDQYHAFVARIRLDGQGADDLLYSTLVGGVVANTTTLANCFVLDDVGDVWLAGATTSPGYPLVNPLPGSGLSVRECAITFLPLLAGGVFRDALAFTTPACSAPILTGAGGALVPATTFVITATNAPPSTIGVLALGAPWLGAPPQLPPPLTGNLLVSLPAVLVTVFSEPLGGASYGIAVPASATSVPSWGLAAEWFFFTNPACSGSGPTANSERLNF